MRAPARVFGSLIFLAVPFAVNERSRKLRAQYTQQSHALRQRIEMRINRIPRKLWTLTMAELLAQAEARELASVGGAKGFLGDVRRLRFVPFWRVR